MLGDKGQLKIVLVEEVTLLEAATIFLVVVDFFVVFEMKLLFSILGVLGMIFLVKTDIVPLDSSILLIEGVTFPVAKISSLVEVMSSFSENSFPAS